MSATETNKRLPETLLAMYACPGYAEPFEERIAAVAQSGFTSVALDFEEELLGTETTWENQLRLAEQYHLPVEHVHLTGNGMNGIWEEGAGGDHLCCRALRELEEMKALGIRRGVIHVTWGLQTPPAAPNETALRRFTRIAEKSEQLGVETALENSVFPDYVAYLFDRIDSPHLGFCFDSGHKNAFAPDYDFLNRFGPRLITMHLHDNHGTADEHNIPFEGTIDWDKTTHALSKTPAARRCITLECGSRGELPLLPWAERAFRAAEEAYRK